MPVAAIAYILQVLQVLPSLIKAGVDVVGFIEQTGAAIKAMQAENRNPSDDEWKALDDQVAALRLKLHAPA